MIDGDRKLAELLRQNGTPEEITDRVRLAVLPYLKRAASGSLEVPGQVAPESSAVAESITSATDCAVSETRFIAAPDPFAHDLSAEAAFRYGPELNFNDSLAIRLWRAHWQRLGRQVSARFGYWGKDPYDDAIKSFLRRNIGEPVGFRFHDGFSYVPTNPAGESLLTTLFYYLAYAGIGDLAALAELEPLVRQMARAIPIGRLTEDRQIWVVALLGAART